MSERRIQHVRVVVTCPNCESPDYEFDLDCDDLDAHISQPCEECDRDIDASVSVLLQSTAATS